MQANLQNFKWSNPRQIKTSLWNTKVGESEPSTHPTQCQWICTLLYVKQGTRWQTATVNSLTASPSSPFRLPKQRWGQPRDRSQEEHSEAQHSQLEHSCHVELCDRLPFCRIFHRALSSLVPRGKIFCSRSHARAFIFLLICTLFQGTQLAKRMPVTHVKIKTP